MKEVFSQAVVFRRLMMGLVVTVVVLAGAVFYFPWDTLRGPLNRYVSEHLGRRFEITQHLSVDLGRTTIVRLDGLEFANPDWAAEPFLIKAKAAEFEIKLWPLILGRVELPRVALFEPQVGLQIEPDGRRSWALSRDTTRASAAPDIGIVTVDRGTLKYRAAQDGADITAQLSLVAEDAGLLTCATRPLVSGAVKRSPPMGEQEVSWR